MHLYKYKNHTVKINTHNYNDLIDYDRLEEFFCSHHLLRKSAPPLGCFVFKMSLGKRQLEVHWPNEKCSGSCLIGMCVAKHNRWISVEVYTDILIVHACMHGHT